MSQSGFGMMGLTKLEVLIPAMALGLFCLLLSGLVRADRRWEQFKAAHQCKVVSRISGQAFNTITPSSNGGVTVGMGMTADQTGWLCDDGVTYIR